MFGSMMHGRATTGQETVTRINTFWIISNDSGDITYTHTYSTSLESDSRFGLNCFKKKSVSIYKSFVYPVSIAIGLSFHIMRLSCHDKRIWKRIHMKLSIPNSLPFPHRFKLFKIRSELISLCRVFFILQKVHSTLCDNATFREWRITPKTDRPLHCCHLTRVQYFDSFECLFGHVLTTIVELMARESH